MVLVWYLLWVDRRCWSPSVVHIYVLLRWIRRCRAVLTPVVCRLSRRMIAARLSVFGVLPCVVLPLAGLCTDTLPHRRVCCIHVLSVPVLVSRLTSTKTLRVAFTVQPFPPIRREKFPISTVLWAFLDIRCDKQKITKTRTRNRTPVLLPNGHKFTEWATTPCRINNHKHSQNI
jgi:hypothetical protein